MVAHEDHLVDLVDPEGHIVSQKLRKDVDKATDLYHGIYVLLITPDKKVVLSAIPHREDLPNLHSGKLGVTAATIRRHGEDREAAVRRVLQKEVGVEGSLATHLGDAYTGTADSQPKYISAYYVVHDIPQNYSHEDIAQLEVMSVEELESKIRQESQLLTPTLHLIWTKYISQLPIR